MLSTRNLAFLLSILIAAGLSLFAFQTRAAGDLTPKEARRVIARLAGIELPSDAVRIKSISPMGNSAVVVAQVETAFRFVNDKDKWRVAEVRTGDRRWEDMDLLIRALNTEKTSRVRAELETIATALEAFRRERGSYVEAKTEAALVDFLSPRYLARVIRLDAWHRPYEYEGGREAYVLRSLGPDGKSGTSDDVVLAKGSR
ncbi:MAG TPA: type II secretion system protein GspG [Pyrinomonadaceae bacterium]|nr:type II secretion system protein GspG [Pyrinomonadaceae bacterium]